MSLSYWQQQTKDKPLFPELEWARPQHRNQAGKLLIAGGNTHGFKKIAEAYQQSQKSNIGVCRVLVPDSLRKIFGNTLDDAIFAPSTHSGELSRKAMDELLSSSEWADCVLLAGEFGNNSETSVLLEGFLAKFNGLLTLADDAIDILFSNLMNLLKREQTTLIVNYNQAQRIFKAMNSSVPLISTMPLLQKVELLHNFSSEYQNINMVLLDNYSSNIIVAFNGRVSTTKLDNKKSTIDYPSAMSVWWLQNPSKPYEALTTALVEQ